MLVSGVWLLEVDQLWLSEIVRWGAIAQGPCNLLLLELSVSARVLVIHHGHRSLSCFSAEVVKLGHIVISQMTWLFNCAAYIVPKRYPLHRIIAYFSCLSCLYEYSRRDHSARGQRCARCKVWVCGTAFSVGVCSAHGPASL